MPIKPSQVVSLLQQKRSEFEAFDQSALQAFKLYQAALAELAEKSTLQVMEYLSSCNPDNRGAEPLEDLNQGDNWIVRSGLRWPNRDESKAWARSRIAGVSTFAVDGSQIYPSKDLSIPVALVQIGWYENPHDDALPYDKDIDLDVMTPADLRANNSGEPVDRRVNMRRFEMEVNRLIEYMDDHSNCGNCLAFLDGSLVVTFAEAFDQETRDFYVKWVVKLLKASEQYRVPLVAYIDTTYARDLAVLLQHTCHLPAIDSIHDAPLIAKGMQWGDRTPLFRCRRPGILSQYAATANRIAFTYLKAHDGYPVRLEMPVWVYEMGRHEHVLDWVRCEIIAGGGYPYVIETADQTAVLRSPDRQLFMRLLQDWADREDLNLRLSRKMVSKVRRR